MGTRAAEAAAGGLRVSKPAHQGKGAGASLVLSPGHGANLYPAHLSPGVNALNLGSPAEPVRSQGPGAGGSAGSWCASPLLSRGTPACSASGSGGCRQLPHRHPRLSVPSTRLMHPSPLSACQVSSWELAFRKLNERRAKECWEQDPGAAPETFSDVAGKNV